MGINPKETKPVTGQDLCTHMFTAPLFTLVKTWKQPKCPSMDEYIKINTYTHTMEYIKNGTLFSYKIEEILIICGNLDEPWTWRALC